MRFIILFIFNFCCFLYGITQNEYTSFTKNDGLPSNNVYRIIEDNKGFLWITTDAGVARFDGKNFQIFTTQDGLPDNEVFDIVKETDGTIWVYCFKQAPAYFDEIKNRFIKPIADSITNKMTTGVVGTLYTLQEGGVVYTYHKRTWIFINKKLIKYPFENFDDKKIIKILPNNSFLIGAYFKNQNKHAIKLLITNGKICSDSLNLNLNLNFKSQLGWSSSNDKFYIYGLNNNKTIIYRISKITTHPLSYQLDSIIIPKTISSLNITSNDFFVRNNSNEINVYNHKTLQLKQTFKGNYLPNGYFKDSKENEWIGTSNKGLLLYRKKNFSEIESVKNLSNNSFLSIAKKTDGTILAGNYNGEIVEANKNSFKAFTVYNNLTARVKKILISNNKIFSFSEQGVKVDYQKEIINPYKNRFPIVAKTATTLNDSIIICGQNISLIKINTRTNKATPFDINLKRITALAKVSDSIIYYGSLDGLYKYNLKSNINEPLQEKNKLFNERITGLFYTSDNLLWIATANKGIVVVKDEQVLENLTTKNEIISNLTRTITSGKKGQIWVGTNDGISVIKYEYNHQKINYSIQNISKYDGLPSNEVNEMLWSDDTMYVATSNGIGIIPANISISNYDIPVYVTKIKINENDTSILSKYNLDYNQKNISIEFAAIELGGHFNHLIYNLENEKTWENLDTKNLVLQLNNGNHILKVKAVDVNGKISNKTLTLYFNINTPFWKQIWFWLIIFFVVQALSILLIVKRSRKIRKQKLEKELAKLQTVSLEQQAFTSLMNPHFMFNALNSIQHYINVQDRQNANRYLSDFASLIRKNFESALQSFIQLDTELENLKIYLRLEQMRFPEKFTCQIKIQDGMDIENWMIPNMLLQPLIENSILHGFMHTTIKGELILDIKEENDNLTIIITDNGIGVENSNAIKQNENHKSHGVGLIKKRIESLGYFTATPISLQMQPAFNSLQNPGNKIIITIPTQLYNAWQSAQKI